MSVIIRLQNLPWSANALDIRNFFRGLSIPEGGVHIVGGELGDAFIAFSTDEDARQAMMLDGGKIKEIQVKLLLSSRSEMHKVIETARQSVPILTLTAQATVPAPVSTTTPAQIKMPTPPQPPVSAHPVITPFSAALGTVPLSSFGIPGIGNPHEIPQPAVIEPPAPMISPTGNTQNGDEDKDDDRSERKLSKEKDRRRTRSRSRSRDRDRKDRKRDRRDRSRSKDRRRRDRSRSRERRDRKRDRKDRSRSRERSPARRSRDRRNERRSPRESQEKSVDPPVGLPYGNLMNTNQGPQMPMMQPNPMIPNGPSDKVNSSPNRFSDPTMAEAFNKLQELGKKRNPNAFQGDQSNGAPRFPARGGANVARGGYRREGRVSRFDDQRDQQDCCVAIRNAPNHTSYGDVRRFFPFMIDKHGIKMINDSMGRRTGNIYVKFCDPRSKQLALQRKSNELKGSVVAVEDLDDETYENAVDSFLPYREENDDEDVSLVIADHEEPARPPFSVLKLADLPNFVKEHDIIKAFGDFSLMSIILNDCRLSRTKIALVQFAKPEDARLAFERKDLYVFGRRQPTVTVVSDEEYENEKTSQGDKPSESPRTEVSEEPIVPRDPRQRRQQAENGPRAQTGLPMQAPTPTAPFFPNAPFVPQQNFGAPFPPTPQFGGFPGTGGMDPRTAATNWANRFPNPADQMPSLTSSPHVISTEMEDHPLDCVLMKGLPREATDRTIVTFLSDTGAVPARIHLMLDTNGLPSGDCFCEFRSVQEARQAASKHGHNLDGCRVTVDLVSQKVVKEALVEPKQPEGMMGKGPSQYFEHPRGSYSSRPFRGRGSFDRGGYERAGHRGSFRGRGNWNERGGRGSDRSRGFERGRSRGFGRGRGGFSENGRNETRNEEENDPALEGFGAPGCVVSLENVPFRATVDDILTFFSEFELTQDDIIRRYNERGQPTGDARVAFRTPFDAQRAVKTRHMDSIYDRRISLSIL